MIQQQYYSKVKSGFTGAAPGMDTVAKSRGITNEFAIGVLNKYCNYTPPVKLANYVEAYKDQYPESLTIVRTHSGEMIIGRTIFVPSDASGESSFFTHNFIIPSSGIPEYIPDYENLLYTSGFKSADVDYLETILPEATGLRFTYDRPALNDIDRILMGYGIDEALYKSIIYAVLDAIAEHGKVYIIPNVKTGKLFTTARDIMRFLVIAFPYSYRKRLGFITYARPDVDLENINVYFLERDYSSIIHPEQLGGRVFDFANNFFTKPDSKKNTLYADYSWANRRGARSEFYDFLNMASEGGAQGVDTLNELCVLWLLKRGDNISIYEENRKFVIDAISKHAGSGTGELKTVLTSVFGRILDRELGQRNADPGGLPEVDIIASVLGCAEAITDADIDAKSLKLAVECMLESIRIKDNDYLNSILDIISGYRRLFEKLMQMGDDGESSAVDQVLIPYIKTRVGKISTVQDLIDEIDLWWTCNIGIFSNEDIAESFNSKANSTFAAIRNKTEIGAQFHTRIDYMVRNSGGKENRRGFINFSHVILETIDRIVIDSINLATVNCEDLMVLKIESENLKNDEKYKVLQSLKGFLYADTKHSIEKSLKILTESSQVSYAKMFSIICRLLAEQINEGNYDRITLAFAGTGEKDAIEKLFSFISDNKNKGETCNYIKWAYRHGAFTDRYADFNRTVGDFFSQFSAREFGVILKNYNSLFVRENLTDGEKNLKHILETVKKNSSLAPKSAAPGESLKSIAMMLLVGLSIVAAIGLILVFVAVVFG
ncbi:MAG: hypothetical protein FWH55_01275 [Oscillospiraceae bacterium]|nr:hypothetical protein [Oscillospiraceae bacterium]